LPFTSVSKEIAGKLGSRINHIPNQPEQERLLEKQHNGYIDSKTFQWESVANIGEEELNGLKMSNRMELFVRKVSDEDGIQLPFTYIGSGKMEYIEGSRNPNGAHLFRVPMEIEAPEDIFLRFSKTLMICPTPTSILRSV